MHHKTELTNDSSWEIESDKEIEDMRRDMDEVTKEIDRLTQAITESPSYDSYMERSERYLYFDDYESALSDIDEAIALHPTSEAYFKKGNIHMMDEEYKLATYDYDEAIKIDDNIRAYFNRASAHVLLGEPEKALETYWATLKNKSINTYDPDERKKAFIFAIILANNFNNYDKAREFISFLSINASDKEEGKQLKIHLKLVDTVDDLDRSIKEREKELEKKNKELREKEKEMLSFFTHTMRNALATAPESLRQAIHLLGSDVYEKDTKHYQAINKIASLFSTLSLTDCLIDTFKQSISDPQEFKQSWYKDHTGEASPKWVIASALRQSLNRITFMSDTTELRKLLGKPETALIKATRKSFIEEVLPLNVGSQGVDVFYDWTLNHIPAIEVSIADSDTLNFGVNQTRFSLLFAITSELILNALKYWDGENRIQISWQMAEQDNYVFSVKNHCKVNATSNLAGTHKGLAFIKRLVELLGEHAQFECKTEDQFFIAELILNKALFDGEI